MAVCPKQSKRLLSMVGTRGRCVLLSPCLTESSSALLHSSAPSFPLGLSEHLYSPNHTLAAHCSVQAQAASSARVIPRLGTSQPLCLTKIVLGDLLTGSLRSFICPDNPASCKAHDVHGHVLHINCILISMNKPLARTHAREEDFDKCANRDTSTAASPTRTI